jgi:hypothetical protein
VIRTTESPHLNPGAIEARDGTTSETPTAQKRPLCHRREYCPNRSKPGNPCPTREVQKGRPMHGVWTIWPLYQKLPQRSTLQARLSNSQCYTANRTTVWKQANQCTTLAMKQLVAASSSICATTPSICTTHCVD